MADFLIIAATAGSLIGAAFYLYRAKKAGKGALAALTGAAVQRNVAMQRITEIRMVVRFDEGL